MTQQMTLKRPRIAVFVASVLAMLAAAIAFAPQANADTPPQHVKSLTNGMSFTDDSVMDSNGNIYLVNIPNDNVQKYTKDGVFIKSWGGPGAAAGKLDRPEGIGIDKQDNVYVADSSNDRIQKFSADGALLKVIGAPGSGNGKFSYPTDVAIGTGGAIYVSDSGNDRIQKFSAAGTYVSKWGSNGSGNGQFNNGTFGIATDPAGNVFVSEIINDRIQKFSGTGTFLAKWGNKGTDAGEFNNPEGLATDSEGSLYVTDPNNDRVQKFTNNGQFVYEFGDVEGPTGLHHPTGISIFGDRFYVSDTFNHRIQVYGFDLPIVIPDPQDPQDPQNPQDPQGEADPVPAPGEAQFDGKNLHIRLKCPARFQPSCHTSAMPMTKKHGGKPMAAKAERKKLAPSQWTVVSFVIKPKYRAKVEKMTDRNVKLLNVTQTIKSKKIRNRKSNGPSKVFHTYRVRSAGN